MNADLVLGLGGWDEVDFGSAWGVGRECYWII